MNKAGYQISVLKPGFLGCTEIEIENRLRDTSLSLLRTVERFGYLGMRPCTSTHLNVDEFGCRFVPSEPTLTRSIRQPIIPYQKLIHVYGGSTTLGSHVSDNETLPYYLLNNLSQATTDVSPVVVNCGGNNHTSLHCALHLLDDCLKGRIPDIAIFINGWNDAMHADGGGDGIVPFLDACLMRSQSSNSENMTIREVRDSLSNQNRKSYRQRSIDLEIENDYLQFYKNRYEFAIEIINSLERVFGTKSFMFLEPSPFISCRSDQDLMPKVRELNSATPMIKEIFQRIDQRGIQSVLEKTFKNRVSTCLIKCQQDRQNFPLFIDETHFTPAFNSFLGAKISEQVIPFLIKSSSRKRKLAQKLSSKKSADDGDYMYPLW
jgi:hypothetical protein